MRWGRLQPAKWCRHEAARSRNPHRARLLRRRGGAGFSLPNGAGMKQPALEIRIGLGSCGVASGGEPVRAALELATQRADARVIVKTVGCNGMCHCEPMVEVVEPGGRSTLYGNVNAASAQRIVRQHLRPAWLPTGLPKWTQPAAEPPLDRQTGPAASYLAKQKRIVLENCGEIDPLNIDDYLARAGYQALMK